MNDLFRVPLDFPDAPAIDEEFTASNGATYRWDGMVWAPIGSGRDVYLPLAGGTMDAGAVLTLGVDPNDPMDAATKRYVDTVAVGTRQIIGVINATNGNCVYSLASGFPNGPLIDAAMAGSGTDIICGIAGTIPPDPLLPIEVWNLAMQVGDVLVSDGARWIFIAIPHQTTVASQVAVIPAVFGATDVQAALEQAAIQDMPPGGAVGQVLTKQTAANYAAEWSDPAATIDVNQLFRQGGNYGNVDLNTYTTFEFAGFGSTATNVPPRAGPATSNWARALFRNQQNNAHVEMLFETEAVNSAGNVYSAWMRSIGVNGGPGPWMQLALGNTGNFVAKTGDTMTGRLQIAVAGLSEATEQALELVGGNIHLGSQTGGNFRYVNRGNNQGGLTFVSSGVPTYVDWLIFNAVGNFVSLNSPGGTGTTIINGDATITGDLSATAGSFAGRVTAALAPTQNAHLVNKGYVDQLFSTAPILVGVIDAGTGNCGFADGTVGPVPAATGSRHYLICTTPGTIPTGPAAGIVMRIGDEIIDIDVAGTPTWVLIAVGMGGILTTADQVALVPNVAGTNNVQAGMQVLNTNKVEKAGDVLTGRLAFDPATGPLLSNPPSTTTKSTGTRLQLWGSPTAANDTNTFGIGVEGGAMWFNNANANNLFKFYHNCVLSAQITNTQIMKMTPGLGRVGFNDGVADSCGYVAFFTQEGTRRGYLGYKNSDGNNLTFVTEGGWGLSFQVKPNFRTGLTAYGEITVNSGGQIRLNSGYVMLQPANMADNQNVNIYLQHHPSTPYGSTQWGPAIRFRAWNNSNCDQMRVAVTANTGGNPDATFNWVHACGGYGHQNFMQANVASPPQMYVYGNISAASVTNRCTADLKTGVRNAQPDEHVKPFDALKVRRFKVKNEKVPYEVNRERWGFVAEELPEEVVAYAAPGVSDPSHPAFKNAVPEGIDVGQALALTVAMVKDLQAEVANLKARLATVV